jgi:putative oxidoreductase
VARHPEAFPFPGGHAGRCSSLYYIIAGPIELVGGILVMIGLFTHWAAFIASGQMAFAYWIGHGTLALLPLQNKGELAALYCFVFLFISTQGGGIWSVDSLMGSGSGKTSDR